MSERNNCAFYSEWKDMSATVPCCDIYGIGNCKCLDCKKYVSKDDRVLVVRCKDCKYLVEIDDTNNLYVCDRIDIGMDGEPSFLSPENDFCSRGERREAK